MIDIYITVLSKVLSENRSMNLVQLYLNILHPNTCTVAPLPAICNENVVLQEEWSFSRGTI